MEKKYVKIKHIGGDYMEDERINYEVLEALREITKLGPVAQAKLSWSRKKDEKFTELYRRENPSDEIGVDYSNSDVLEYHLRMEALSKGLERSWASYINYEKDGLGLEEYVSDYLVTYLNNKNHTRTR